MLIYTVTNEPHTGLSWQGSPKIPAHPPNHNPTAGSLRTCSEPPCTQKMPKPPEIPRQCHGPAGMQRAGMPGGGARAPEQPPGPLSPAWSQLGSAQSHTARWHCQFQHGKSTSTLKSILSGWQGWRQMLPPGLSPKIWGYLSLRIVPQDLGIIIPQDCLWNCPPTRTAHQDCP